jgi:hypothetical protein
MNPKQLQLGDPGRSSANRPVVLRAGPSGFGPAPSRRHFLRAAAGAAGLVLGGNALTAQGGDDCPAPVPIPGGVTFGTDTLFHVYAHGYPGFGGDPGTEDPSTIYDFNGTFGLAYVRGMGTHTDKVTGARTRLPWEVDLRFMKGEYVGADRKRHHGAFAFV